MPVLNTEKLTLDNIEKAIRCEFCNGTAMANPPIAGCHSCGSTGMRRRLTPLETQFLLRTNKHASKVDSAVGGGV